MAFTDDLFSGMTFDPFGSFQSAFSRDQRHKGFDPFSAFFPQQQGRQRSPQQERKPPAHRQESTRYDGRRSSPPQEPPRKTSPRAAAAAPPPKEVAIDVPIFCSDDEVRVPSPRKPKKVYNFTKEEAARRIQPVVRGFLVRRWKPIKQLRAIKGIEKKFLAMKETVDAAAMERILANKRERMILNERVTLLVLELDEIKTPFLKDVRRPLYAQLHEFARPLDEMDEREASEKEAAEKEASEKEATEKEEDEVVEQQGSLAIDEENNDGFLIVGHSDLEEPEKAEEIPISLEEEKAPVPIEQGEVAPLLVDELPIDQAKDVQEETKVAQVPFEKEVADQMKQLLQDNAELRSMVSRCLVGIEKQNDTISKLKRRVLSLERALRKRQQSSQAAESSD